jgi:hypothetical protein
MRLVFTLSLLVLAIFQTANAACNKPSVTQFDPATYIECRIGEHGIALG